MLLDIVRAMMSFADLPISFWGYALEAAAYLLNRVSTKVVVTLYVGGIAPNLNNLKIGLLPFPYLIWSGHNHLSWNSVQKVSCSF